MKTLRNVISEESKDERHRHNLINIHITVLGWIVEFIGALSVLLGTFIFGQGSAYVTFSLQTLTIIIYFNILPCVFLINDVNVLTNIAATEYYLRVLKFFNWHRNDGDEETYEDQEEKNSDRAKVDEGKDHKHVKQIRKDEKNQPNEYESRSITIKHNCRDQKDS